MNEEEMARESQALEEEIKALSDKGDSLTKKEKFLRRVLLSRQDVLSKMKLAREKKDHGGEMQCVIVYGILNSWAANNPLLLQLVLNLRGKRPLF